MTISLAHAIRRRTSMTGFNRTTLVCALTFWAISLCAQMRTSNRSTRPEEHLLAGSATRVKQLASSVGGIWRSMDGGRRRQLSEGFLATVFGSIALNPLNEGL